MKPEHVYKDVSALAEKNHAKYLKRMGNNKYWKLGYKAGKKDKLRKENPYKLSTKIQKLLRKRTFWDMGWEEAFFVPPKPKHGKSKHKHKKRKHK